MGLKIIGAIFCVLLCISSVSAVTIESIFSSPDQIVPGESAYLELTVKNNADTDIEEILVQLDFKEVPFAPYKSSSAVNIEKIKEGKSESASFQIIALNDAKSGIYKIPLEIKYKNKDSSEIKTESFLISMIVNSEPVIEAEIEDGTLLKGKENVISIKIVNKGLGNIKFLEAEIEKSSYYSILSPEKVYIGDLDSDDFDSAEFKLYFKDSSQSSIKIPLILRYKDTLNKEFEEPISLTAKAYSQEQAIQLGLVKKNNIVIYVGIVIAVIIAYIVYRRIRKAIKRRKEKEE